MKARLRLTNDAVFKFVFSEDRKSLLNLVNSVFQWSQPIIKVEILPNESVGLLPGLSDDLLSDLSSGLEEPLKEQDELRDKVSKRCLFDLRAFDEKGREYNIELQMQKQGFYSERALFYWARVYSEKIGKGESYKKLKPVIGIHFLGFNMFKKSSGYHSRCQVIREDLQNGYKEVLTDDLNLHFIEMPKCATMDGRLETWVRVLTHAHMLSEEQVKNIINENPEFAETFEALDRASRDPRVVTLAERMDKADFIENSRLADIADERAELDVERSAIDFEKSKLDTAKFKMDAEKSEIDNQRSEMNIRALELVNKENQLKMIEEKLEEKRLELEKLESTNN